MLRSFRVSNHKSIRDEVELLLMPAYDRTRPVVPVAGVFGANAAGKSNLLDALRWMRWAVDSSFSVWRPGSGVPRAPFRLDPAVAEQPSVFCVEVLIEGVRTTYGFVVDDDRVLEEWLYAYPRNRKRVVFERDGSKWSFGSSTPRGRLDSARIIADGRHNALFLSIAAHTGVDDLLPLYYWFQHDIIFMSGDTLSGDLIAHLGVPGPERKQVLELVRSADLGITGIDLVEAESPQRRLARMAGHPASAARYELAFTHGSSDVKLGLADESDGTREWLKLVDTSLMALRRAAVLVVDELDTSLHPRLTARLVELFRSERSNPHGAQLLFSTHDAALLGTSFGTDILARDEVWFVEKDGDGATHLFALSDFHPRKDENTERRYLGGSYGAVPAVYSDTLVERLAETWPEPASAA